MRAKDSRSVSSPSKSLQKMTQTRGNDIREINSIMLFHYILIIIMNVWANK